MLEQRCVEPHLWRVRQCPLNLLGCYSSLPAPQPCMASSTSYKSPHPTAFQVLAQEPAQPRTPSGRSLHGIPGWLSQEAQDHATAGAVDVGEFTPKVDYHRRPALALVTGRVRSMAGRTISTRGCYLLVDNASSSSRQ